MEAEQRSLRMTYPFYTIGHGTRRIDEFIDLLRNVEVAFVADVRTMPRSRANPQYNGDTLQQSLERFQVRYEHIAALGGLRGKQHDVEPVINAFWQNDSFHNYADYAMGQHFHEGLARLKELGCTMRCAIMCAETVWWRCHRRIIADYLIADRETVFHILGQGRIELAHMTAEAKLGTDGTITYPAVIGSK
jgi:uncharacterized protein (DUF488 family)